MHSFFIVSPDAEKQNDYVEQFCKEKGIGKFDQHVFQPLENSFGITDVRSIQKTAFFKPQGKSKALILKDAQLLTTEAQNALLKLLEEPPVHTYILLLATSDAKLLPTILSRCTIVRLENEKKEISVKKKGEIMMQITSIANGTIAEKLSLAEKLASQKSSLNDWLQEVIRILEKNLLEDPTDRKTFVLISKLQEAYVLCQTTNVGTRMILEHAFLELT